jgi:protein SCO1
MKYTIALFIIICLSISCKQEDARKLPYYDTADFTPKWELPEKDTFHAIRNFNLIDQHGAAFTEKNIEGKICVADFFFTICPGICPKMTNSMADLQDAFIKDDDVLLLSHSVTPEKDNVEVLQKYGENKGVQYPKWRLLTGQKSEIYDLGRRYYFVEEDLGLKRDNDDFLHTENFILIDKKRHIRGIYNGLDPNSMAVLTKDIQALKQER